MDSKLKKFEEERLQSNVQMHLEDDQQPSTDELPEATVLPAHKKRKRQKKSVKPQLSEKNLVTPVNPILIVDEVTLYQPGSSQLQQITPEQTSPGETEAELNNFTTCTEAALKPHIQTGTSVEPYNKHKSLSGKAGANVTTLKAAEVRKYIHVWNMESNVEDVRHYLRQLCPAANCTVDELRPKGHYKSYKIGIPLPHFDTIFSVDVWPLNAQIKLWFPFIRRYKSNKKEPRQTQHTFRPSCGNQE
ncbi:hypothetical protein PYW08_011320 [Mythimna loreyi]|uniref:Uncharacterized protein n=1 Tax=Mythimna loreyi TaxID=667449 RepID=A0ACC2Q4V6_9NEOP|nr:hypothetical protein PYW08_011320 [Mythimna loreyi]